MFFDQFSEYLSMLIVSPCKLLVVGDFNFHMNVDDADAIKTKDILETFNLLQVINEPTHISGHTLDLVITRSCDNLISSVHVPCLLSDHGAIRCKLNLAKPKQPKQRISYIKFKTINHQDFEMDIKRSDLFNNPESDLDKLLVQFDSTLRNILNKHAPLIHRNVTIRPSNPWYSNEIAEAKRKRKQLERRWRKTKSEIDRNLFKQQRLLVSQMTAAAKHSVALSAKNSRLWQRSKATV